jgi:hypothetical protein
MRYIFLVKGFATGSNTDIGYMPFANQYGFVKAPGLSDRQVARTIAHELGHGAFGLKHTFDPEYGVSDNPQITRALNLMGYNDSTHLAKFQWDIIHEHSGETEFESSEEVMMASSEKGIVLEEEGIFVDPNNQLVKLPAQAEILYMCNYEDNLRNIGYLYKFRKDNKVWESRGEMSGGGYLFEGYYSNGEKYTGEKESIKGGDIVWVVKQNINYNPAYTSVESRNLSIQKVRIKSTEYSSFYYASETLSAATSMTVTVNCGNSTTTQSNGIDWTSLKPELDKLNGRLNGSWNINVIDKEGTTRLLATGNKGTVTYKHDTNKKKWIAEVLGISDQEVKDIIVDAINKKLEAFQIDENGNSRIEKTTTTPIQAEDGGEFRFGDGLHWYEWGSVLCDAGISIYETSHLPETYWNQSNPKYKDYPLHTSPTFTGVADGAMEEITGMAQLVKLGVEVVTDKEKAQALWNSIKNISISSVREAAIGAMKSKWDKYANSPDYVTYHELGKDGVQVASMLYGGFLTKGKKLSEAVEESGEIIKKKADDAIEEVLDQITKQQNNLVKKVKSGEINLSDNFRKGNFGEMATDVDLSVKGYKPIHTNRVADIDAPMKQGIDGVFEKNGEYFIVESKYHGTSKLKNTNDGPQMSDDWINGSNRLNNAVGDDLAEKIRDKGYKRILSEITPDGKIEYKLLDINGKETLNINL